MTYAITSPAGWPRMPVVQRLGKWCPMMSVVYISHQNVVPTNCLNNRKKYHICGVSRLGPFKCYVTLFFWKLDPHLPPRNANNIEYYTFVTLFSQKIRHPHPHLRYVTLEWPLYSGREWGRKGREGGREGVRLLLLCAYHLIVPEKGLVNTRISGLE